MATTPLQDALAAQQYYNNMNPSQMIKDPSFYGNTGSIPSWVYSDPTLQGISAGMNYGDYSQADYDKRVQEVLAQGQSGTANSDLKQMQNSSNAAVDYATAHPDQDDSFMDKLMGNVFPLVVGGFMGAGALGLLGDGTAAAGAAGSAGIGAPASGTVGAGSGTLSSTVGMSAGGIPTITTVGAAGGGGLGALPYVGLGAGFGLSGMGGGTGPTTQPTDPSEPTGVPNTAVDPNIPQVPVVGSAGTGGLPASTYGGSGLGLLGAGAVASGVSSLPSLDSVNGVSMPDSSLPPLVAPSLNDPSTVSNSDLTPSGGTSLGGLTGSNLPGISLPGVGQTLGGLGTIAGGIADYHMNNADKDYYQSIIDKLNGMYNPGTPEANLMQSQMDAKDAAAGRNSQYGTRAINLAGTLNQQRSNIMTSPGYVTLAQDARGHYDNSLNGLFSAVGQASTAGSNLNGLLNSGIGSAINTGIKSAGSYLSNLFGGS